MSAITNNWVPPVQFHFSVVLIILFEPRVIANKIDFEEKQEEGILNILIDYTIRQTNRRTNIFYFVEGTDLREI